MDIVNGPQTVQINYDNVNELSMKIMELLANEEAEVGEAVFALSTTIVRLMKPQTIETFDADKEMDTVTGMVEYMDAMLSTDKKES